MFRQHHISIVKTYIAFLNDTDQKKVTGENAVTSTICVLNARIKQGKFSAISLCTEFFPRLWSS